MPRLGRFFACLVPRLTVALYKSALSLLLATCRWRIHNLDAFQAAACRQCILMLWHDRLLLAAPLLVRYAPTLQYTAVISASREGQLLSALASSYSQGRVLSISHKSRVSGLKAIIQTLQQGREVVILTPDGPRGPRHHMKSGIALAAIRADATVIPVTWRASRFWEFTTWDRLALPKPFSTIEVSFGDSRAFSSNMPLAVASEAIKAMMLSTTDV